MSTKPPRITRTPRPSVEDAAQRYLLLDEVIRRARNHTIDEIESALGLYMVGFHFGWKVLHLIHSKRTIRKYEEILGVRITEVFDDYGPDADRTNAYRVATAVSNFWKAVSGEEKPPFDVDKKALVDKET